MFLSHDQIAERLRKGGLIIDPSPDESSFGDSVHLRIGTYFSEPPSPKPIQHMNNLHSPFEPVNAVSAKLGDKVIIQPRMPLLGTTLEFVRIPADLLVICFQRSSLARLGLTVSPTVIEPSYEGRLALELVNHGPMPLAIYPGQMIVNLYFAEVRGSKGRHLYHGKYARLPQPDKAESIERLKDLLSEREKRLEARHRASKSIQQLLDFALHSKGPEKGKALERLAVGIFQTIEGLRVLKTNPRLAAEELDIVLQNDIGFGFWRFAGSPIVVECKNWSSKVGSNEIKVLSDNLRTISPDAKTGILVAPNGISGNEHRDALAKVREKRQQGQYIIILDDRDLNEIAQGTPAASVVEMKYTELLLL